MFYWNRLRLCQKWLLSPASACTLVYRQPSQHLCTRLPTPILYRIGRRIIILNWGFFTREIVSEVAFNRMFKHAQIIVQVYPFYVVEYQKRNYLSATQDRIYQLISQYSYRPVIKWYWSENTSEREVLGLTLISALFFSPWLQIWWLVWSLDAFCVARLVFALTGSILR